jgi:predicted nuclease of predicted toxin-antitoxin system
VKLLFDQNLSFKLCGELADLFPGSVQVRSIGLEKAQDREIWNYAKSHGFAIVSLDSDFSELAAVLGPPPHVIWLRVGNQSTSSIVALMRNKAEDISLCLRDATTACLEIY